MCWKKMWKWHGVGLGADKAVTPSSPCRHLAALVPTSVVLSNAEAGEGIGSLGGKTTWKQDFVEVGGFHLDAMENLHL